MFCASLGSEFEWGECKLFSLPVVIFFVVLARQGVASSQNRFVSVQQGTWVNLFAFNGATLSSIVCLFGSVVFRTVTTWASLKTALAKSALTDVSKVNESSHAALSTYETTSIHYCIYVSLPDY